MVDQERILVKIAELDSYLNELRQILPKSDIFDKLAQFGILSERMAETLKRMKGFCNILVHEYGRVDDLIVFDVAVNHLGDFEDFKQEVLAALKIPLRKWNEMR
jgi:uncharacterized protein YutE (UPF0331/DUF86 family)